MPSVDPARVGEPFVATNGKMQGCSMSVLMLNSLMAVFARVLHDKFPQAINQIFVDDITLLTPSKDLLQSAFDVVDPFLFTPCLSFCFLLRPYFPMSMFCYPFFSFLPLFLTFLHSRIPSRTQVLNFLHTIFAFLTFLTFSKNAGA